MIYFTAHTFKCVCHCRRAMFRVLGMYNFALGIDSPEVFVMQSLCNCCIKRVPSPKENQSETLFQPTIYCTAPFESDIVSFVLIQVIFPSY